MQNKEDKLEKAIDYFNEDRYDEALVLFNALYLETKDKEATYFLGLFYDHGYGVERDENKAISYYRKASRAGSIDAAYMLQTKSQTTIIRI